MLIKSFVRPFVVCSLASASLFSFSSAQAGASQEKEDSEALSAIVEEYGINVTPDGLLGSATYELKVYGCSRVVYPGAQATCKLSDSELTGDEGDIVMDSIIDVLGPKESGLGVTQVAPALISCSRVVYPGAAADCTITELSQQTGGNANSGGPLTGGNVSVGGKTSTKGSENQR